MRCPNSQNNIMKVLATKEPKIYVYSNDSKSFREVYHKVIGGCDVCFYTITYYENSVSRFLSVKKIDHLPNITNEFFEKY